MPDDALDPALDDGLNRLLRRMLADREGDGLRDEQAYREAFPELGERVALELQRMGGGAPAPEVEAERLGAGVGGREFGREFGRYRLLSQLGRGGQGTVYLAEDRRLGRRVALKLLPTLSGWSPAARGRFEREAQLAASLDHPGLCPVYEAGEVDGVPFVAMRYVEGHTFAREFARARDAAGESPGAASMPQALGTERATALVAGAAHALHAAHRSGIVHRDVKPGNLMVEPDGRVCVLDFGLAREVEGDSSLTRTGEVFGTPRYMAPEQIDAARGPVSPRTDVWALGAVLYEALCGRPPFDEPVREALYRAILSEPPQIPRGLPRDLATVVETALAKEPNARYASAEALALDLEAAAAGRPIRARRTGALGRLWLWARRAPRVAALAAGLVATALAAAGLLGFLLAKGRTLQAGQAALERDERAAIVADIYGGEIQPEKLSERVSALARWPADVQLRAACAIDDYRNVKYDSALALLDAAPPGTPEPRALERVRALVLSAHGRADEAQRLLEELGPPAGPEELYTASRLASIDTDPLHPESFEPAYRLARRAYFASPEPDVGRMSHLARLALACGEVEVAEEVRDALLQRFPDVPRAWMIDALIHSRFQRSAEALASYERCLELEPGYIEAQFSVAILRAFAGDLPRATEAYETAVALEPEPQAQLRWITTWSRVMAATGEPELARVEAERALEIDATSAQGLAALEQARALLEAADVEQARAGDG